MSNQRFSVSELSKNRADKVNEGEANDDDDNENGDDD